MTVPLRRSSLTVWAFVSRIRCDDQEDILPLDYEDLIVFDLFYWTARIMTQTGS